MFETLGIIGLGFVGSAIHNAIPAGTNVHISDPSLGYHATYEELATCDGIFICVPTAQRDDGSCDTSILITVLAKLKEVNYNGVIISKSTAPPATYQYLQNLYPNLVHVPEFLTAANAKKDYIDETLLIIGGAVTAYTKEAERLIRTTQHKIQNTTFCTIVEASLMKYARNSFFATKVVFMNELEDLANKLGCDYKVVSHLLSLDAKVGKSHMAVPGPDGLYGFGGACFPKDTAAMLHFSDEVGGQLNVLRSAVSKNLVIRLKTS